MHFVAKTESDMHALGQALASCLEDGDVVTLNGSLGAGKTQLAQGVGEGLGISIKLVSPTFNIVFEYESPRVALNHFDLYRLEDAVQLEDVDFFELSDPSTPGASLIEWAELFPDDMPEERLDVEISVGSANVRELEVTAYGSRGYALADQWQAAVDKIL